MSSKGPQQPLTATETPGRLAWQNCKRATRRLFGSIKTLCWTDHANLTRAQTSDIGVDPKRVRWVAEILVDGSEIRSLSGRSATLGDSFSRSPKDRDALLAARTKDLEGLTGQLRGFDLDQYLGEGTEGNGPVPAVPMCWHFLMGKRAGLLELFDGEASWFAGTF